jgi:hypothetical protein
VLACRIDVPMNNLDDTSERRGVWVLNTHLGAHHGPEQEQQAKEIQPFVESLEVNKSSFGLLITMDANAPSFWAAVTVLKKDFIDTYTIGGLNPGFWKCGTFPSVGSVGPMLKIDYIFVHKRGKKGVVKKRGSNLKLIKTYVVDEKNSPGMIMEATDHRPLCAVFDLDLQEE